MLTRLPPGRAALFFALVTVLLTWPMALRPAEFYAARQDLYLGLWNLWWVGDWASHPWTSLFHTELLLFPFGTGLEVQPLSLFQSILAAPLTLTLGPLVTFNLLVLFSFWFAGWMTYRWVRELTGEDLGACVAGVVFSFSPYHFTYLPELNLLPVGMIPLYLMCALRLARTPGRGRAIVTGVALAMVGLCDWYYGIATGLVALALSARRIFPRTEDGAGPRSPERYWIEAFHWGTAALILLPVVLRMAPAFLGSEFIQGAEREGMGLAMKGFKGTGYTVWIHGYAGVFALFLAAFGCRPLRRALPALVLVLSSFVLSLGPSLSVGESEIPLPFALLERLPLLGSARYPDRFFVLTQLGLALLAGLGVMEFVRNRAARGLSAPVVYTACVLLLVLEYWPGGFPSERLPQSLVPVRDAAESSAGAVFHVPTRIRSRDGEQMWFQLAHHRPIAGGYLTRRDEELVQRLGADPLLGALLGSTPRALPETLRTDLAARGFAYVSVRKGPLCVGTSMEEASLAMPFCFRGHDYLRQRLFPRYEDARKIAAEARAWIEELTLVLGPPWRETADEALFRLAAD